MNKGNKKEESTEAVSFQQVPAVCHCQSPKENRQEGLCKSLGIGQRLGLNYLFFPFLE